ncbi:M1 family aminopeptidase [Pedobacter sp. MC2016-14]|uniref:M1 family metallopeptidase n=1 Tax=Pedobacter sp. MC2016-14 TaxID=2897327 RepID=UPI001E28AEB5|nr:M1 family aminopeptidase [Pedobacter sp. MC2016-14]MCD0489835.1 M1 family aminopeptidase [Pedobacter sp. MC2016-14]
MIQVLKTTLLSFGFFALFSIAVPVLSTASIQIDPIVEAGVSRRLAVHRKSLLSKINYGLNFSVPLSRDERITLVETISFQLLSANSLLQIDFKEDPAKIKMLKVNGLKIPVSHKFEHLLIAARYLKPGKNMIVIELEAGEGALNRNSDYLYTLFVPDRARTVFPCFDQPDLKAIYDLTLNLPSNWEAMANGPLKHAVVKADRKTFYFESSDLLSTYLFAFSAGKFEGVQQHFNALKNKRVDFLYRETDTAKIKRSIPDVYKIHEDALSYYENWTGIPYPFKKFGFVAIPDFQFGGMEHPGNIHYRASTLFLDEGATKDQRNSRNNLIAHETAHMWFGDMVTMNWFSDVWMKEVFANFMADKSMEDSIGRNEYDLKFLVDHVPAAYGIDRTRGSNPIRQDLDNLKDAGSMYGNIIYHKAPIMMRQLERLMGEERFQLGVRKYLKDFAYGNASWPDLINILSQYTSTDLLKWNKVWVNETGRPIISYDMKVKDNIITNFTISQKAEYGENRVWPQTFELTFFYPNHSRELTIHMNAAQVELKIAAGMEKPIFVLFNSSGQGYGLWPVDTAMMERIYGVDKPLTRASAYVSLYENMLSGRLVKPEALLNILLNGLDRENEELNLKLISNYISSIYWTFISPAEREKIVVNLEQSLWKAMEQQTMPNHKKILFKAYQDIFSTSQAGNLLYTIWKNQAAPEGIKLTEDDYTSLSYSLALRPGMPAEVLNQQLTRITNPDRRKRFEFIVPALSNDESVRDVFFRGLELKSNREKESNVTTALVYLHHPLRQDASIKYLAKSLDMLTEIQITGDIFFPESWLQATFGSYQSSAARKIVSDFLATHPTYNPKLKAKILQATDNLFRTQQLLK